MYNYFGKQPDIKENILYDSISMQLEKILMQSIGIESRSMVAKDQDWGNILWRGNKDLLNDRNVV